MDVSNRWVGELSLAADRRRPKRALGAVSGKSITLSNGRWSLVVGRWSFVVGHWSWSLVVGRWAVLALGLFLASITGHSPCLVPSHEHLFPRKFAGLSTSARSRRCNNCDSHAAGLVARTEASSANVRVRRSHSCSH